MIKCVKAIAEIWAGAGDTTRTKTAAINTTISTRIFMIGSLQLIDMVTARYTVTGSFLYAAFTSDVQ
jgi:hypothetical protein